MSKGNNVCLTGGGTLQWVREIKNADFDIDIEQFEI